MPTLNLQDLRVGDLMMTKHQGGMIHNVISFGSFFSGNFGTANYVHAQIVCQDNPIEIAESHAEGLHIEAPYSPATVFRLNPNAGLGAPFVQNCTRRAGEVAIELNGRQDSSDSFAQYNLAGAAGSLFLTTSVSNNVVNHLRQIENGSSHAKLFCSQFVVVCYQVAILRMVREGSAPKCLLPFAIDSKSMEPAYLVSYMRRNPNHWQEVGDFPGN